MTYNSVCLAMPKGTAHKQDTPSTKRWMRTYETNRQKMLIDFKD